ncbi:hypothetical protein [Pseudomonas fluorescens]|uniref:hypothetical protein n=1 Tax=Pseudomonas fluorescens TaxID=294 RepID=UPI00125B3621|nr:hypothetical protein [Pseudomonas fluorescens]VVN47231.1 hypothetical protein PS639_05866 [Pseudomonas fluorescens]
MHHSMNKGVEIKIKNRILLRSVVQVLVCIVISVIMFVENAFPAQSKLPFGELEISGACSSYEKRWSSYERKVWHALCVNGSYYGSGSKALTPISSKFLNVITNNSPYREVLERKGVSLDSVDVKGGLELVGLALPFIKLTRFKSEQVKLLNLVVGGEVDVEFFESRFGVLIEHSVIGGGLTISEGKLNTIDVDRTTIRGDFNIDRCVVRSIYLRRINVEGDAHVYEINAVYGDEQYTPAEIHISGGRFHGELKLGSIYAEHMGVRDIVVGGDLLIENVYSPDNDIGIAPKLDVHGSDIGGSMRMWRIDFNTFDSFNTKVDGVVSMSYSKIGHLLLRHTRVGEDFRVFDTVVGSEYANKAIDIAEEGFLSPLFVGGSIIFMNSVFIGKLVLDKAEVGGDLVFDTSRFGSISAMMMKISREFLIIGTSGLSSDRRYEPDFHQFDPWGPDASLDISYSIFDSIASPWAMQAWPQALNIQGFKVRTLRVVSVPGIENEPPEKWIPKWLEHGTNQNFTFQPYKEISGMLRNTGNEAAAVFVEYAARERQRLVACKNHDITSCAVLTASKVLIGYGYFIQWSLLWSVAFVLLGAWIFRNTPESKSANMPIGITYSFDMFIPLIRLRESNYKIEIKGLARYYFYLHRITGWIMGSFIVAGLSGFTK